MREFEFEDRNYQVHEIKRKFGIKDKTWRIWVYGDCKKKKPIDKALMGLTKVPGTNYYVCLLYTSPSPRDRTRSRMPSSA